MDIKDVLNIVKDWYCDIIYLDFWDWLYSIVVYVFCYIRNYLSWLIVKSLMYNVVGRYKLIVIVVFL